MKPDSKHKIIFGYEKAAGGGAFAMQNIITEFNKFKNIETKVITLKPINDWGSLAFAGWILKNIFTATKYLHNEKNIKWVYTSNFVIAVSAVLVRPFRKFRICYHYHVSEIPDNPYVFPDSRFITQKCKIAVIRLLHYLFMPFTDLIIAPSEFSKRELLGNYRFLTGYKVVVQYNGIAANFFKQILCKKLTDLKRRLHLTHSEIVITYFGRLEKHKHVHDLINAFGLFNKTVKSKLLIIYLRPNNQEENKYRTELLTRSKKMNLTDQILWLENPNNLSIYYRISDVVVLLSESEQMPLTMLESFACKTLFIARPAGGIKEVLEKIDKQLILKSIRPDEVYNKLRELAALKNTAKNKMVNKEFSFVKYLNWRNVAGKIYLLLDLE
jgi:glycosyltransferase involved in cell wall biosynthesis